MKNIITLSVLFITVTVIGQRKYAASQYFKDYAFVKSAKLYHELYQRGDSTKLVLNRLADSYYYNNNMKAAEKWYAKLFELYEQDSLPSENYFRYAQALKSNKKYQTSDIWLLKFRTRNVKDSRGTSLEKNSDYLATYTKNRNTYRSIHNLSINSKYSDYGGFMLEDKLYFSSTRPKAFNSRVRKYHWNEQPYYNIYTAKEQVFNNEKNINFTDVTQVEKLRGVNSKYHDAGAVITKDGKTMYFTRDDYNGRKLTTDKEDLSQLKIFTAELVNGLWTNIRELPFNSSEFSTRHPALSPDEKTLYFVSDRPGGYGKTDVYKVAIHEDKNFGEPVNLGRTINTEGVEMFPFMSQDSTFYFSSNGHIGLGGLDVFESALDKQGDFKGIMNVGVPINSAKDDFAFSVRKHKKTGYFSSNRLGGKGDDDIYSFVLQEKKKPCNVRIVGQVKDKVTNRLLAGASVTLFDENQQKLDSLIVGKDAKFEFILPCHKNFTLIGFKRYYKPHDQIFYTKASVATLTTRKMDLRLNDDFRYSEKLEMIVNIKPIYFDYNKATIRPDAAVQLDKVVRVMQKYPEIEIRSSSHTDARGKAAYNTKLSERRAQATVQYIIAKGIDPKRISGKGFGESQLVNGCSDGIKCSEEEHQQNRRTEFVIVKKTE